ncbi:hypothetical protein VPH35_105073 [Triticum aestivum]
MCIRYYSIYKSLDRAARGRGVGRDLRGLRRLEHEPSDAAAGAAARPAAGVLVGVGVREPTVPRLVHAGHLVLGGDAQQPQLVERQEQRAHGAAHPRRDHQDQHHVRAQQPPSAAHEQPVRPPRRAVDLLHVLPAREQRREDDAPRAAPAVQLRRLQRVVELEPGGQLVQPDEHPRRHEPADDRRPRVHHGAPRGDRREAAQEAVADVQHVPVPRLEPLPEQRRQRRRAAGEGGRHGRAAYRRPLPVDAAGRAVGLEDGEERAGVEPVPAKPQQEGAQDDERRAVPAQRHRSSGVVEPPNAGALDERAPEPGHAADHVDNPGPGEVDDAGVEEQRPRRPGGGGPAVGGPDPVGHHRVDEAGEEGRVDEVGHELRPLRDGAGGYPGRGDGEGPLEEEEAVVEADLGNVTEAEEVLPDEAVGGRTEGEGEAEEVVEERAGGGVEHVGEHDVHGVLGPDGARAEHGEAELHGEHQVGGEEQVRRVDRRGGVRELVAQVVRRVRRRRAQQRRQARGARRHLRPPCFPCLMTTLLKEQWQVQVSERRGARWRCKRSGRIYRRDGSSAGSQPVQFLLGPTCQ